MVEQIKRQLARMGTTKRPVGVRQFLREGETQANTTGSRSLVASWTAPSATRLIPGERLKVAVPAYEQFSSDGTGGNTETFNLNHDVIESPNTQNVLVYIAGDRYGQPDAVDLTNDTIDVTDPGSNNNVHVWYIPADPAGLELDKSSPKGGSSGSQNLYSTAAHLINEQNQSKQPEVLSLQETPLQEWVPTDFRIELYVEAPYTVRFTDAADDGATADSALFQLPVVRGSDSVEGLAQVVKQDMSR